jgi:hypothetical protein
MAYSEQRLGEDLRETLRRVTVFQMPFPVQFAVPVVMAVDEQELRDDRAYADGTLHLLELHPMLRWCLDAALPQVEVAILQRYAQQYSQLARDARQAIGVGLPFGKTV